VGLTGDGHARIQVVDDLRPVRLDGDLPREKQREETSNDEHVQERVQEELAHIVAGRERLDGVQERTGGLIKGPLLRQRRVEREGLRRLEHIHDEVIDRAVQRLDARAQRALRHAVERRVERAHGKPRRGRHVALPDERVNGRLLRALRLCELRSARGELARGRAVRGGRCGRRRGRPLRLQLALVALELSDLLVRAHEVRVVRLERVRRCRSRSRSRSRGRQAGRNAGQAGRKSGRVAWK
jgi:hypothetical protein